MAKLLTNRKVYGRINLMNKNMLLSNRITTRKCTQCKEMIIIENYLFEPQVEIIHFENKSYHKHCFKEMLESKKKYRDLNFDIFWSENIDRSNNKYWSIVTRNHLYKYIADLFEITYFTSAFYQKMEQVFNGKWKNVTKPVPAEHLLDMLQRKRKDVLNAIGYKKLTGMQAFSYALAMLLNKYDGYLDWIEKSKENLIRAGDYSNAIKLTSIVKKNNEIENDDIFSEGED